MFSIPDISNPNEIPKPKKTKRGNAIPTDVAIIRMDFRFIIISTQN